jgi:hypothetical protein
MLVLGRLAMCLEKLADRAHRPVLYISKNKTVDCNMQVRSGASRVKECSSHGLISTLTYQDIVMKLAR